MSGMLIENLGHHQVGLDAKAQAFLSRLDNDSKVGKMVDCTSAYELEQEEYLQRSGEPFFISTESHAHLLLQAVHVPMRTHPAREIYH